MMDIGEPGYYVRVWFVAGDSQDGLRIVQRRENGDYAIDYRFRYYADPDEKRGFDPFDEADQKSFYTAIAKGKTEDEVIEVVDGIVKQLVADGWCGTKLPWKVRSMTHRHLVRGDGRKLFNTMVGLPFVHISRDPALIKRAFKTDHK